MSSFSSILRQLRTDRGLTQFALAAKAGLGINTVCELEKDYGRMPNLRTMLALAKALDVGVETFASSPTNSMGAHEKQQ